MQILLETDISYQNHNQLFQTLENEQTLSYKNQAFIIESLLIEYRILTYNNIMAKKYTMNLCQQKVQMSPQCPISPFLQPHTISEFLTDDQDQKSSIVLQSKGSKSNQSSSLSTSQLLREKKPKKKILDFLFQKSKNHKFMNKSI